MGVDAKYNGPGVQVAPDVLSLQTLIANVCFVGFPEAGPGTWVLVDTGMAGTGGQIRGVAEERFGPDRPPACIILTHGHFDHVGTVKELSEAWDVPVYAHERELPYLNGERDYPEPDPTVGGGLMAWVAPLYPNEGIDLGDRIHPLPADGTVPGLEGWRWIHTPGHTPGHISLFRAADRVLIAGDAFITVKQESAIAVMLQEQEVHGPPSYFTTDWAAARESVQRLNDLRPAVAATGHGVPMGGSELARQLAELAAQFDEAAVPDQGRYVPDSAQPERRSQA
jgi:glyoxylase-like metal-dependent hydrolase (beta-lactamase superfamily II)